MANRLNVLLSHVTANKTDSAEFKSLKQSLTITSVEAQFTLSAHQLQQMSLYMLHEMRQGLSGQSASTLKMLPSYVYKKKTSDADGVYYALDLGGTNFRAIRMLLRNGNLVNSVSSQFAIPKEHMTGTAEGLFSFIAESLLKFVKDKGTDDATMARKVPLGFTFSFPVQQHSINSGSLIEWTKGFSTTGVPGQDVVKLLQVALDKISLNVKIVALCNDTVGTLIARYFEDNDTQSGVILGTGANACYWERSDQITKDPSLSQGGRRWSSIWSLADLTLPKRMCCPLLPLTRKWTRVASTRAHKNLKK